MSTSSKPSFFTSSRTPKGSLSARGHIDKLDAGLHSIKGAQEIVGLISSRHSVTKLVLGHNDLGDDGCVVLFKFLRSPAGRKYRIAEISLNSNGIGNRGLLAVASYLKDNTILKELFLQNNDFTADPETILEFTQSLNSSTVELLSLTLNRQLSDDFTSIFLPTLDSPHLTSLHLSALNLSPLSLPYITEYLSDTQRCRLRTLKCNGNVLGFRAVRSIINTISNHNWRILALELHSNHLADNHPHGQNGHGGAGGPTGGTTSDGTDDDDDDVDRVMDPNAWKLLDSEMYRVLNRNATSNKDTAQQALRLLKYARIVLLQPSKSEGGTGGQGPLQHPYRPRSSSAGMLSGTIFSITSTSSTAPAPAPPLPTATQPPPTPTTPIIPPGTFPFLSLPIEIQLYILSLQTPILTPTQRNRIYHYASSLATLPPLLPRLSTLHGNGGNGGHGHGKSPSLSNPFGYTSPYNYNNYSCVPNPTTNLDFLSSHAHSTAAGGMWKLTGGTSLLGGMSCHSGVGGGKCMGPSGSLVCYKEKERKRFLGLVGCDAFDPRLPGF
ncbi:hypothetical protein BDN72DRAFT_791004 [Pluteus cervinus]|uniref:Uncharacterized protein n=1 Tax=Pluteus cervinus TaxID=181527 RepID=A0ACD3B5P6_9AGAR|nr:hypothetical protein BDN72DRAFT_791004 [Pluteus cervinus]